jgi:uncharacterized protein (TIGR02270 family)
MSPLHSVGEPLHDLIDESLDEASFLWRRWESELTSLTRNLDEIWSWTEDRLHGALDGVRIGGANIIDMAAEALGSSDLDRITATTAVLASSAERDATDAVVTALGIADGEKLRAIVRALELLGSDQVLRAAASALAAGEPAHAGALCRLKAFRRVAPGDEMLKAVKSNIPEPQIDAVRAAPYLPARQAEEWITAATRSGDAGVRSAAVESGLSIGTDSAWNIAKSFARQLDAHSGPYLKLVAMFGSAEEHEIVYAALPIPALQVQAIWALGHIGTVRAVESCIAGMQYEPLARACGEAYSWITGADLARDGLAAQEVLPDVPAFEDDDLEANLVPPPEALWPLPEPEAVRRHWAARRTDFADDVRHVRGVPTSRETLTTAIETGPMLRRPDLVLELRARTRGKYDVEPRAFTSRQRQMMAASRAALSSAGGR